MIFLQLIQKLLLTFSVHFGHEVHGRSAIINRLNRLDRLLHIISACEGLQWVTAMAFKPHEDSDESIRAFVSEYKAQLLFTAEEELCHELMRARNRMQYAIRFSVHDNELIIALIFQKVADPDELSMVRVDREIVLDSVCGIYGNRVDYVKGKITVSQLFVGLRDYIQKERALLDFLLI